MIRGPCSAARSLEWDSAIRVAWLLVPENFLVPEEFRILAGLLATVDRVMATVELILGLFPTLAALVLAVGWAVPLASVQANLTARQTVEVVSAMDRLVRVARPNRGGIRRIRQSIFPNRRRRHRRQ